MKKSLFNDNWSCDGLPVTLPHDAMLQGGRRPDAPSGSAGALLKAEAGFMKRALSALRQSMCCCSLTEYIKKQGYS